MRHCCDVWLHQSRCRLILPHIREDCFLGRTAKDDAKTDQHPAARLLRSCTVLVSVHSKECGNESPLSSSELFRRFEQRNIIMLRHDTVICKDVEHSSRTSNPNEASTINPGSRQYAFK
eukprot:3941687-Rhodomonas_salina.7